MTERSKWCAVILAGGESRRMGTAKALLDWRGVPLAAGLARRAERVFGQSLIVCREPEQAGLAEAFGASKVMADRREVRGCGPLAGLYTAMSALPADRYLAWACDMPALGEGFLQSLKAYAQGSAAEAIVPMAEGRRQPLAAVYRYAPDQLLGLLNGGRLSMNDWLGCLKVETLEEAVWREWSGEARPFANLNTPDEWRQWLRAQHEEAQKGWSGKWDWSDMER